MNNLKYLHQSEPQQRAIKPDDKDADSLQGQTLCELLGQTHSSVASRLSATTTYDIAVNGDPRLLLKLQSLATHQLCMQSLSMATRAQFSLSESYINLSMKLMKMYILQMDCLRRYENAGSQNIRVERIDVSGGHTAIGNINPSR